VPTSSDTPDTPERWSWPAGRAIVLYDWSWFDRDLGEVVGGWSQQSEADDAGYVHMEADALHEAQTRQIHPESRLFVFANPHTFSNMTPLPLSLKGDDGLPLPWIRALLGSN
jgi:hypothetical protein